MQVSPFAFRYQGNGATPANILIPLERQLIALQLCRLEFSYNETFQQTFRPLLSKLSKRRQIQVLYTHFEEVRGGVEPWLMARWKARVEFLLSVIGFLFMVALCNRADQYIFMLWFVLLLLPSSSFFFLHFFPRLISAAGDWMFTILWHMVWPQCEFRNQV